MTADSREALWDDVQPPELRTLLVRLVALGDTRNGGPALPMVELADRALTLVTVRTATSVRAHLHLVLGSALLDLAPPSTWDVERSIGQLCRAATLAGPDEGELLARIDLGLGRAYHYRICGEREENEARAVRHAERAVEHFTRLGDHRSRATASSNLAVSLCDRQIDRGPAIERAISLLEQAVSMVAPGSVEWCDALSNLGQVYAMRENGDPAMNFSRARESYEAVAAVEAIEVNPRGYADTNYKLGTLLFKESRGSGDDRLEQALIFLAEAERGYLKAGHGQLDSVYVAMHHCHSVRDERELAITRLEQALAHRSKELHPVGWARVNNLLATTRLDETSAKSVAAAVRSIRESLSVLSDLALVPLDESLCLQELAHLYRIAHRHGDPRALDQARQCLNRAGDLAADHAGSLALVNRSLAETCLLAGDWAGAADALVAAVRAGEESYADLLLRRSQEDALTDSAGLRFEAGYALARAGRVREAVVMAESARARLIGEALARTAADLRAVAAVAPQVYQEYHRAAEQMRAVDRMNRALSEAEDPEGPLLRARLAAVGERAGVARARLTQAITAIREIPGMERFLGSTGFAEIADLVDPEHPLAYLICTRHGSLALLLSRTTDASSGDPAVQVRSVWADELTLDHLSTLIDSHSQELAWAGDAFEVAGGLMRALAAEIPQESSGLTLVPGGPFGLLPVAFAPFGPGEDSLADRMPVAVALSAETLRLSRDRPHARSTLTLAVGDPLGDTPFAAHEANEVLRQARERDADLASMVLLRNQASTSAVADQLARGDYGVAHFACHGVYDQDRPLASGLALADGWLTLGELLDAELAPFRGVRLAVLSACESAMSTTARPDEALGLPAAVTYAGAGCVIGSLWLVEDSASYLLMARFHSELGRLHCAEGIPAWAPAQALRRAQRWLRSATAGQLREQVSDLGADLAAYLAGADPQERPYQHPAFWAPFVVVGH